MKKYLKALVLLAGVAYAGATYAINSIVCVTINGKTVCTICDSTQCVKCDPKCGEPYPKKQIQ